VFSGGPRGPSGSGRCNTAPAPSTGPTSAARRRAGRRSRTPSWAGRC